MENKHRTFHIVHPDEGLRSAIQSKINNLNKPKGSLGRLETLAEQICMVQQTLSPSLQHPCHLLLGGDHGIEREGVSVSPREVTWQQMINFSKGGGGVNKFCRQHHFDLKILVAVAVGLHMIAVHSYYLIHLNGQTLRKANREEKFYIYILAECSQYTVAEVNQFLIDHDLPPLTNMESTNE